MIDRAVNSPSTRESTIQTQACKILGIPELQTKTRIGIPTEEIICEIIDGDYELVIIGDHRPCGLARLFQGPIAKRVAEQAPCSVAIVRGKVSKIRKILLCDSGAQGSLLNRRFTTKLIDLLSKDEEITILHVMSQISAGPGVRGGHLRADADALIETHSPEGDLLERDIHTLEKSGLHPVIKVRHGLVVDEILAETRDGDYDLVVIGSRREKWQRFWLDDLSSKIIARTTRSVLVIR